MKKVLTLIYLLPVIFSIAQSAGSLDPTFGTDGKIVHSIGGTEDKAYGVAIQSDDKIVVAGYAFSDVTGKDFVLVRYNPDGTLDTSFGTDGVVTTDVQLGSEDVAYDLAIQGDGKIVAAGYSDDGSDQNAAIVRYNTDGSLDETFGVMGVVLTDYDDGNSDELRVVKIHALTGKIIVGGSSIISTSLSKPVVARYLENGTIDTTFNSNGIRLMWITDLDDQYIFSVEDLVVQSSGKITAVGWRDYPAFDWDSDYWAGRINSDGSMDVTFSLDGVSTYNGAFNGHDRAYGMLLNPDNSFYVSGGGYITTLKYDCTFFDIEATGGFGGEFESVEYGTFLDDVAYSLAKDSEGAFIMAGSSGTSTEKTFAIEKLTAAFVLDASFGDGGKVTTTFDGNDLNESFDMLVQSDNKIVAVGYTGNDFAIARYLGEDVAELEAFLLQTPTNSAVNQNYAYLSFNWTNAFGATSYELDLDVVETFTGAPETFTTVGSGYAVADLLPNQEYFWRVRASDGDEWGEYSEVWSFTTNSLENFMLVSPSDGATGISISDATLDWSEAIGASDYELQIDTSPSFTDDPEDYSTTSTSYNLPSLELLTTYYWRVRASNNGVDFGEWTDEWEFTTTSDVGLEPLAEEQELRLYPNPTFGNFNLMVPKKLIGSSYVILDISGKVVSRGLVTKELSEITFDLEAGYYYLKFQDNSQFSVGFCKQ